MSLNVKKIQGGGARPDPMEPGSYPGWLSRIVYVGLQPRDPYKGEEKDPAPEMFVTYEMADEFMPDGEGGEDEERPRCLFENFYLFNLSVDNAKSTKRYYALDPKDEHDGDWEALVGTPCMVTMVQNKKADRVYENVSAVSSMRAKDVAKMREPTLEQTVFTVENFTAEEFEALPDFLQGKVKQCLDLSEEAKTIVGITYDKSEVLEDDEIPY